MIRDVTNGTTGKIGAIRYAEGGKTKNIPVAYVAENGILKRVFKDSDGTITKVSTTPSLITPRYGAVTENIGDYLLIAGGKNGSTQLKSVEAINSSLTVTAASDLSTERELDYLGATHNSKYAMFLGKYSSLNEEDYWDLYDASLTKSVSTQHVLNTNRLFAGHVGDKIISISDGDWYNVWDSELSTLLVGNMLDSGSWGCAVSFGNYVVYASYKSVVAINASGTVTMLSGLTASKTDMAGVATSQYAVFAGGKLTDGLTYSNTVDAYNVGLTKVAIDALDNPKAYMGATRLGNYVMFAGGYNMDESYAENDYANVVAYDSSLTKTTLDTLPEARHRIAGGTVGDYAVFAGGRTSSLSTKQTAFVYKLEQ